LPSLEITLELETRLRAPKPGPEPGPTQPEPSSSKTTKSRTERGVNQEDGKRIATTRTVKGMDKDLILRTDRHGQTREAHTVQLANLHYNSAYYVVFIAGITYQRRRLHCTELPPKLSNWLEILRHDHQAGFLAVVELEYSDLQ
jgi:hypothetical protein